MRESLVKTEEFKDSPVERIPIDWQVVKLLDHVSLPNGQLDPKQKPYCDWILIAPDHIESETGRLLNPQTAAEQNAISGKYGFQPGDVLYSKIRPYLRKAVLADREGLCSADMYPLRPGSTIVPRFLLAVILGEDFSRFATAVSMRSGFPKLNREELGEYRLALPPYEEQKRIAEILDTVDEAIAHTSSLIAKLKQMKAGLLHDLLTGGLDENGELRDALAHPEQFKPSQLGQIPKEWDVLEVNQVSEDITYGLTVRPQYVPQGIPLVSAKECFDGWIDYKNANKISEVDYRALRLRSIPKPGDVLFTKTGTVGRVARIKLSAPKCALSQNVALIKPRHDIVTAEFLELSLKSESIRRQTAVGITTLSIPDLQLAVLGRFLLPIPPKPEQSKIVICINSHDTRIRTEGAYRDKLKLQKQGLMHDLLTGKVRVKDA
jgi:type I restriction enzyme S subunit